jgi:hypothetical protein
MISTSCTLLVELPSFFFSSSSQRAKSRPGGSEDNKMLLLLSRLPLLSLVAPLGLVRNLFILDASRWILERRSIPLERDMSLLNFLLSRE